MMLKAGIDNLGISSGCLRNISSIQIDLETEISMTYDLLLKILFFVRTLIHEAFDPIVVDKYLNEHFAYLR